MKFEYTEIVKNLCLCYINYYLDLNSSAIFSVITACHLASVYTLTIAIESSYTASNNMPLMLSQAITGRGCTLTLAWCRLFILIIVFNRS